MVPPLKWSFEFEITTAQQADSIVENLNEQERKKLFDALNKKMWTNKEKKESKEAELATMSEEYGETVEKKSEEKKESKESLIESLEFEEDTFKIDSKGWKEEWEVYNQQPIKVKINATWDVVEYLEWPAKWEQIFITYDAFIREVMKVKNCSQEEVEQKYLMTVDELQEKMKDKPSGSDEYKKFFNKEVSGHLAGYWYPGYDRFHGIGAWSHVWLVGGCNANFGKSKWGPSMIYRNYGLSGRLLKN